MSRTKSRSRFAVLGALSFGAATGYEIRKLLQETTAHFWKESYGQLYPTLEALLEEGLVKVDSEQTSGRATRRFSILDAGREHLTAWIRSPEVQMKPGRNELLLKLFFATASDAEFLVPQVRGLESVLKEKLAVYESAGNDEDERVPPDRRALIGTTVDLGITTAKMQLEWCERTLKTLKSSANHR